MGLIYILVRNYPWWGIPLGLSLIIECFRKDGSGQDKSGKKKAFLLIVGVWLTGTSAAFLYMGGHKHAVPLIHEIFKEVLR